MNYYTFPVMLEAESAYKEEYYFRIEKVSCSFNADKMNIIANIKLTSEYIKSLIKEEKAYMMISATTVMKRIIVKMDSFQENVEINIPMNVLVDYDNISVKAFILVKKEFELKYNSEMQEIYKNFVGKNMDTNMQLAISNNVLLYYKKGDDSFVSLSKTSDLDGKGMRIDIHNPDSILIKAGDKFCDAYAVLSKEDVIKELIDCFIAFIGVYHTTVTLYSLKDKLSEIKELKWYEGYSYMFAKNGINIDTFFDNEDSSVEDMFVKVQEILGNELEATFIRAREALQGNKGGVLNGENTFDESNN